MAAKSGNKYQWTAAYITTRNHGYLNKVLTRVKYAKAHVSHETRMNNAFNIYLSIGGITPKSNKPLKYCRVSPIRTFTRYYAGYVKISARFTEMLKLH